MGGLLRAVTSRAEAGLYSLLPTSVAISGWRDTRVETVGAQDQVFGERCELGESPVWDARRECLFWLDLRRQRLHAYRPASGESCTHRLPAVAAGLALCADQRLLLATSRGFGFYNIDSATFELVPGTAPGSADQRYNDGRCDRLGRFWCGTMRLRGARGQEALWRYDGQRGLACMDRDYTVCNGLGWSVDGRTLYLTDTDTRCIYAYAFDLDAGQVANRRIFVDGNAFSGRPDGLTVDAEGGVWVAMSGGWELRRFDPQGRPEGSLRLPVPQPTSCTFGGPDLRTLYVTTSRLGLSRRDLLATPWSGYTFAIHVGVAGLGDAAFAH